MKIKKYIKKIKLIKNTFKERKIKIKLKNEKINCKNFNLELEIIQ